MSTARQRSPPCTAAAASREQRDGAPRTRAAAPTAAATSDLLRDDARHHLPDVGSGAVAGGGLEAGFVESLARAPLMQGPDPAHQPVGDALPGAQAQIPPVARGWPRTAGQHRAVTRPAPPSGR